MAATAGSERFLAFDRTMRRVAWGLWLEQERQRRETAAAGIDPSVPYWLALMQHATDSAAAGANPASRD